MSFPLMVRAIRLALEGWTSSLSRRRVPRALALARIFHHYATVDATRYYRRHRAGFARSLGEFGAPLSLCFNIPGETRTIPSAMYTLIQTPGGEGAAARLCLISIVLALYRC